MKSYGLVYVEHDVCRNLADLLAEALDSHAPDLLGLSFRILLEASCRCGQQHLKWIHTLDVRRDRNDGDHTPAKTSRGGIGAIVAHDYGWSALPSLGTSSWIRLNHADLATMHLRREAVGTGGLPCLRISAFRPFLPGVLVGGA